MSAPYQPLSSNTILDAADLVDRLSRVHVSKSSHTTGVAVHDHGDDDNDGAADCDEVVEHTETTHDETLSVAGNGRAESHDLHDDHESLEDVSVMTGSFGNASQHLGQQWQGPKRPRHESGHAEGEEEDDDASGDASGFSLDAMVGHSSCESSVTWYEGSHIDEVTVDEVEEDDRHDHCDDSHEDMILQCFSSGEETVNSNVEVIVEDDDETMFEWTSTESFFGDDDDDDDEVTRDNINLEQSLAASSSSASSACASPLSSPPPLPQPTAALSLDRDD